MNSKILKRLALMSLSVVVMIASSARFHADTGTCGGQSITLPFTDVPAENVFFCAITEAFLTGLTNGTTPTTYSPSANVPREQMAAFVTRTLDQSLKRGSRRGSLGKWWTPTAAGDLPLSSVGASPQLVDSDGADLWVASGSAGTVSRVRASDGKVLDTWTGATFAVGVIAAKGRIFVAGRGLFQIDPTQTAGAVTLLDSLGGSDSFGITFDGSRIWATSSASTVWRVTLNPLSVTTVGGFGSARGILYDGANIWVTDLLAGSLNKLDGNGNILQTVMVGPQPQFPIFDGTNIWVPNRASDTVTVVRASTGAVLATLSGNGLNLPISAAFDGERILVTNFNGDSVSMWKASDLSPLGSISIGVGSHPFGACSDGLNFWIALAGSSKLARF